MALRRCLSLLATTFTAVMLAACGGGGGGGGGDMSETPVQYSGNSGAAEVTTRNAAGLAATVFGGGGGAALVTGLSLAEGSLADSDVILRPGGLARRLSRLSLAAFALSRPEPGLIQGQIPIDETEPCESGSVRTFGTLSDNSIGTLEVHFNNCRFGAETLNGRALLHVDAMDSGFLTDYAYSFVRLTLRGAGLSVDFGGVLRIQVALGSKTETIVENVVSLDNLTGRTTKSEFLSEVNVYNDLFAPSQYTSAIGGRIYDSVDGFVEVSTQVNLEFDSLSQPFPSSGQSLLVGAGNRSAQVTALSSSRVRLDFDVDGDAVFESRALLRWADLTGPVGADLGDDDGDGMHNAWETANGLNPFGGADATHDNDGDGATNLKEYEGGTDPNSTGSVPPPPPPPSPLTFSGLIVSLPDNSDLVYDPGTQRIYASVRGNPGSVVPIDPVSGALGAAIPVGADPIKLARSHDGQYLYVGLDGSPSVQRINLATQLVDLTIPLGADPGIRGDYYAQDIAVLPGSPQSIAVSLRSKEVSPIHSGVAIYDNDVRRTTMTGDHTGSNVIEFSASSAVLYGYNNESTEFGFRTMSVDASGVVVVNVHDFLTEGGALISGFSVDMEFHAGVIYSTTGRAIDPVARTLLGTFFAQPWNFSNSMEADASIGRVFYLSRDDPYSMLRLRAFDVATRDALTVMDVPQVIGEAAGLLRWGTHGLAFRTTSGQVFLTQSPALVP